MGRPGSDAVLPRGRRQDGVPCGHADLRRHEAGRRGGVRMEDLVKDIIDRGIWGLRILAMGIILAVGAPAFAADEPKPLATLSAFTGTEVLVTQGERREFVTARVSGVAPLFAGLSAFARLDL